MGLDPTTFEAWSGGKGSSEGKGLGEEEKGKRGEDREGRGVE